jgi:HlyD family secretion protein
MVFFMYTVKYMQKKIQDIQAKFQPFFKRHMKKIGGIFVVLLIIIIIGGKSNSDPIATHIVEVRDVVDQVILSGRTESTNFVDLGFADAGRVGRVFVTEGQQVRKGQVLAELEMGDLQAQLSSAQAGLTIAQSNANQLFTNVTKVTAEQNAIVETARRALFGSLEAYPDDVFSSRIPPIITGSYQGENEGEYVLDFYSSNADTGVSIRYSGLEQGVIPLTLGTRIPLGTKGLFIQFSQADGYANTQWTIPVPNTRSALYSGLLNQYQTAIATRDRVINTAQSEITNGADSVAQARVEQARATVNQILSAIQRRRIIAPFSGTISKVVLKQGESTIGISAGTSPGVSMLATDQYRLVIKIPEIDVARVLVGSPVDIILDAYGAEVVFPGILTAVNPAESIVDGVPVYEGVVVFTDTDDRIRSGMTALVTITVQEKQQVLAIPANYIQTGNNEQSVVRLDVQGNQEMIKVTTGIRGSDSFVEIVEGLNEGDVITLSK